MLLSLSYILHLLATVIWLGGLFVLALLAWGARQRQAVDQNQWVALQRQLLPWIQASLIILLVTGFYQMTVDPHYSGFLAVEGVWGWALLLKHIAYIGLVGTTAYWQFSLLPDIGRLELLLTHNPDASAGQKAALHNRERRLLTANCVLALLVLIFTGIMTAV